MCCLSTYASACHAVEDLAALDVVSPNMELQLITVNLRICLCCKQAVRPDDAALISRLVDIMREGLAAPDIDDPDAETQRRVLQAVIALQACLVLKLCSILCNLHHFKRQAVVACQIARRLRVQPAVNALQACLVLKVQLCL